MRKKRGRLGAPVSINPLLTWQWSRHTQGNRESIPPAAPACILINGSAAAVARERPVLHSGPYWARQRGLANS